MPNDHNRRRDDRHRALRLLIRIGLPMAIGAVGGFEVGQRLPTPTTNVNLTVERAVLPSLTIEGTITNKLVEKK